MINIANKFLSHIKNKYKNNVSVSNYIIERLIDKNINTAFGYNGGAALPLFDAISKNKNFNMIFNRHEQSSGHCAESYSKMTNNIGVVITTSGPGFTNVITPLQDAYSDGIPLLCISCQVSSNVLNTDAFQESNTIGISKSCVKNNYQIKNANDLPIILEYMIDLSEAPRKGPVHLDICKDILIQPINLKNIEEIYIMKRTNEIIVHKAHKAHKVNTAIPCTNNLKNIDDENFKDLEIKIKNSKKPVLLVGAGATNNYLQVREFIKKYNIPATTTLHGLGIIDETTDLALKMIGMHGSYQANMAIQNADLIIGMGNRFDDRTIGKLTEFAPQARKNKGIVHIDNSYKQITKIKNLIKPDLSIHCSTSEILNYLNKEGVSPFNSEQEVRTKWLNSINKWRKSFKLSNNKNELTSNYIISTLSNILKDKEDYILTTGVGSHQMVTAQYFNHRLPNKLLTSGSLGTMGVGLPFAIGAQIARPTSTVILIDGDGSFTMSMNEIASIIEYKLPIKIFIMNDKKLQMVDYWQELLYDNNKTGSKFKYTPEFDKIADTFNIMNYKCDNKIVVKSIIEDAINHDGPVLVNFMIDKSYCLPFVPPNTALNEMIC
jgi:acetolactate synthase I/II/III large subunit